MYAIVVTWMEADVIAATVRNALAQGCERVILVDNESPDDTVAAAIDGGPSWGHHYTTPQLDEILKIRLLNDTVARVSDASPHDHIWWLWLDADEFPHGPGGSTVREMVTAGGPSLPDRRHPVLQPLPRPPTRAPRRISIRSTSSRRARSGRGTCPTSVIASTTSNAGIAPDRRSRRGLGFHAARADVTLVEPTLATFTHHFPYRLEEATRRRFDTLCGHGPRRAVRVDPYDRQVRRNARTDSDMSKRYRTLKHVYAREWALIENLRRAGSPLGVELIRWCDAVDAADAGFTRWYSPTELEGGHRRVAA